MKKIFLLLLLPFLLFACKTHIGSGKIISETRNINPFNEIEASSSIDVEIEQADKTEVVVEGDDNLIKFVEIENRNGLLTISYKSGTIISNSNIKVKLKSPVFNKLSASSSSSIISKNTIITTDKISIEAISSADIDVKIDAPNVDIKAESSSSVDLRGRAKMINAKADSSADIDANNLKAETVTANAESSSSIYVFCSVKLNASASSSGSITYTGGVTDITKNEQSSGTVSPK